MFEHARKNIGIFIARMKGTRRRRKQMSFTGAYTKARTALFIVPPEEEHRALVVSLLQQAQTQFVGNAMNVVTSPAAAHALAGKLRQCTIVPVHEEQVGFFFLPRRDLIMRLKEKTYDVIVDLNLALTPLAAAVCAQIDAPLKAGFSSPQSETLFNFQVKTAGQQPPVHLYERLVQTLAMF